MTTVLITGATSGIGLAIARRYAREGYDLALAARTNAKLAEIARELSTVRVDTFAADLAHPTGAAELAAAVADAGLSVDILVNNAGAGLHGRFSDTPLERELDLVRLNMASVLVLTKALLPAMLARGRGHIVNVASVAAFLPGPYQSVYYASKAFLLSFSDALAEELRGTGVGVTAVCPGPTATGFHAAAGVRRARPLNRALFLTADAVAEATWRGVRHGRRLVVPGWRHRLLVLAIRLAPRRLVARASARAGRPGTGGGRTGADGDGQGRTGTR
jgi:short-subunit dehydrogenase